MKTMVQRWGNSLALRIPKAFADEISVIEGDEVEMKITRGRLIVAPKRDAEYQLQDLLDRIKPSNLQDEVFADNPTGREVW